MKKSLCITVLIFLFLLAGCVAATPDAPDDFSQSENGPTNIAFLSSMGCNDQTCTDAAHHHFTVQVAGDRELTVVLDTSLLRDNYFSIDQILVYEGEELLQTIETTSVPPVDVYLWEGLFVNRGEMIGEPDIRDLNFDGSQDFGLLAVYGYSHNVPYSYFLWNETEGQFNYGFTLFGSAALEIDAENQQLIEHYNNGMGDDTTIYSYASNGMNIQQQTK